MNNQALLNFVQDPKNPVFNFKLGKQYEDAGHTAAAASFYLRAAEFSNNDLFAYESLLRMGLCFSKQGLRVFTVKGVYLKAIALMPNRPEAYFLLARTYEQNREWQEAYTWASMCSTKIFETKDPLTTTVEYPGLFAFVFEQAVAAWWLGLYDQSVYLFRELGKLADLPELYKISVNDNLNRLSNDWKTPLIYDRSRYPDLRLKFPGARLVDNNYSQCYQDMFVLTMLQGKRNGLYLEIGCGDPYYGNNTALLEEKFGWKGIAIDIDFIATKKYSAIRKNNAINANAATLNYCSILHDNVYDYLQIDCDPATTSFNVLQKIPFETHSFAVITFEHDNYCDESTQVRDKSRRYLESFGYKMVVNNIAPDKYNAFEDWWVLPQLIDSTVLDKMICISEQAKRADLYMLNKI